MQARNPQARVELAYTPTGRIAHENTHTRDRRTFRISHRRDGNRLLSECKGDTQQHYLFEPDSFVPLALVRSLATNEDADDSKTGNAQHDADDLLPPELLSLKERYPDQWAKIEARRRKLARQLGQPPDPEPPKPPKAEVFHLHTDHLGTPREVTDTDGHLVWTANYAAWGKAVTANPPRRILGRAGSAITDTLEEQSRPIEFHLRIQGQYFDVESGLHYNRFRYYDPDVGRFASQDPIRLAGGENFYGLAPSPTNWLDVLGLTRCRAVVLGRRVYKDNSLIDPTTPVRNMNLDWTALNSPSFDKLKAMIEGGATNVDLMKSGYAPFGLDGKSVNLHHVIGQEPGPMVELAASTHQRHHRALHGLIEDGNSFRNDPKAERAYNRFRRDYWKERAKDFDCP